MVVKTENGLALASYCINGINIKPLRVKRMLILHAVTELIPFLSLVDDLFWVIYLKFG